jgi:FkbM family methyltransferase
MSIVSYAQNFEDVMLWRALGHIEHGLYIDIGAQDPVVDSVSMAFHEHGWRGIHVEPTPHYAELLRQQRPGDKIIQAAVGSTKGILPFFEIPHTGISTADATIANQHRKRGFDINEISVPCITLASIFKECPAQEIHWLKIDVEGLEERVLRGWGAAKARPWIVVVESTLPLTQTESHESWEALLLARHYSPVYFDGLNRYYVSAAHPELKPAFAAPPNVFDAFKLNGTASSTLHQLIDTRHQSETITTLEQHRRQRQDLQDEIERLSAGVATLGAAQEKHEDSWAARERELAAGLINATVRAEAEKVTLALDHERHEHELHAEHTRQEAELTQRLKALESERSALQQEYVNRERLLVDQTDQAREKIAELLETQAQRDRQAHALAEDIRALQAQLSRQDKDLNAQVKIAQQNLRAEQATRARRAQNTAMRLLAIHRQAKKEKAEIAETYSAENNQLQRDYADQESLLKQELETAGLELDRLRRNTEALKEQHVEVARQLQAQLETAEKIHAQRALELTGRLLEGQQQAARESAEQAKDFLLQERTLQRRHVDQQGLLTGQLKTAQFEIERLLKHHAEREDRHAAIKNALKTKFDSALGAYLQRERELTAQLRTNQQQAAKTAEEQALKHLEQERGLRLQLAQLTDLSNTEVRTLNADLAQRERHWKETENSLLSDLQILQVEAQTLKESSAQAEQQHSDALNTELSERARQVEAWSALEVQLRREIALEKSASLRFGQALEDAQNHLLATQTSFSWRVTAPLRTLELLSNFRSAPHLERSESEAKQASGFLEPAKRVLPLIARAEPPSETATSTQSELYMPISEQITAASSTRVALTLVDLLARYDEEFVECAYQTLLGRAPDPEGKSYYLGRLRTGISKMKTVKQLCESPEGKKHSAKLPGLDDARRQFKLRERPVLGWFARKFSANGSTNSVDRQLRALDSQLWLFRDATAKRFNKLEHSLTTLHHAILQQSQSIVTDLGGMPTRTSIHADAPPQGTVLPDGLKQLSPRARDIYFQLKTAAAMHSRGAA